MRISDWSSDVCSSDLQAERRQIVARHIIVAFAHLRADRGWRGVEDIDPMLVDDLPEAVVVGVVRHTLEHQGCRAILERAVDDIAVAGDPADVGAAPENLARAVVEAVVRSEEHPSELQSLMRISYAVFFLKKKKQQTS